MPISTPTELLDAFEKSGEFDRLRRDRLASFQKGDKLLEAKVLRQSTSVSLMNQSGLGRTQDLG